MGSRRAPAVDRFAEKVALDEGGCLVWMASRNNSGYGTFAAGGRRSTTAHRWSYEHHYGPIPTGLQIDHLCRNPLCVNPDHLEAVTPLTNLKRGTGSASKTHCPAGHPYAGDNLRIVKATGHRVCVTCRRANDRRYHYSKKA